MARPKEPLLSREIIARAAIELIEEGKDLQIVPLAERLGVSKSSLYHHVRGRTGVIHAIREVLGEEYQLLPTASDDWEETVRASARSAGSLYGDHPRVLPLLLSVVIDEPATVGFYSVLVDALERAGIPEDELLSTVETIDAFAFGVALDALSPDLIFDAGPAHSRLTTLSAKHPTGKARNALLFERGLDLLVLGIRERGRIANSSSDEHRSSSTQ